MTVSPRCPPAPARRRLGVALAIGATLAATLLAGAALAQGSGTVRSVPVAEPGQRWGDLRPAQKAALKPLEREWSGIDARSQQKWIELSTRFPTLSPSEQARIQERMGDWAKLTPKQRGEARMHFQEAKQLPPQDRQARWEAYQALTPEQRARLAGRADRSGREPLPQAKSNIVPNPADASPPRAVAPTVVQGRPGATTTLVTRRPSPPGHQQTGLPKIAATPDFVDRNTLLPQRGPQGAAARSVPPPAEAPPRK
ncbi:MAG TPA: DUF3106 domain-containing protein [Burkholderiaceae bacterium]|nr:DUF3106 domain-containing protein [Burkholderiaceae bacterium]